MIYDKHKSHGYVDGFVWTISVWLSHFSKGRELMRSVCASRGSVWDAKEERRVLLEMWQPERGIRLKPVGCSNLKIYAIGGRRIIIVDARTIVQEIVCRQGDVTIAMERKRGR